MYQLGPKPAASPSNRLAGNRLMPGPSALGQSVSGRRQSRRLGGSDSDVSVLRVGVRHHFRRGAVSDTKDVMAENGA